MDPKTIAKLMLVLGDAKKMAEDVAKENAALRAELAELKGKPRLYVVGDGDIDPVTGLCEEEEEPPKRRTRSRRATDPDAAPDGFDAVWKAYPKRGEGNPKKAAMRSYRARLLEKAFTPEEALKIVEAYAEHCAASGKLGTPYVMQTASFFGAVREGYKDDWTAVPATEKDELFAKRLAERRRSIRTIYEVSGYDEALLQVGAAPAAMIAPLQEYLDTLAGEGGA